MAARESYAVDTLNAFLRSIELSGGTQSGDRVYQTKKYNRAGLAAFSITFVWSGKRVGMGAARSQGTPQLKLEIAPSLALHSLEEPLLSCTAKHKGRHIALNNPPNPNESSAAMRSGLPESEPGRTDLNVASGRCQRCGWRGIQRSARRGVCDHFLSLFGRYPFRCRRCGSRFYLPQRSV